MIRHIVLFSVSKAENKDRVFEGLKILENIEGNWTLTVKENMKCDPFDNEFDFIVYGEFANENALEEYRNHPIYQESISRVRPLRDKRIAIDIPA